MDNQRNDQNGPTPEATRGPHGPEINPTSTSSVGEDRPQWAGLAQSRPQKSERKELTAQRLREQFAYDPETGLFTRLISKGGNKAGTLMGTKPNHTAGYCSICIDQKPYFAHRLAWLHVHGEWPVGVIDHVDGNPLNNRIANLRDVHQAINMQNLRRARTDNKATGLLGVNKHKGGKFGSALVVRGVRRYLGLFSTAEEAHQAYLAAKRIHHSGCTI